MDQSEPQNTIEIYWENNKLLNPKHTQTQTKPDKKQIHNDLKTKHFHYLDQENSSNIFLV